MSSRRLPDQSTWSLLPKTQADALEQGTKHFYTGRPCNRHHVYLRKASSGNCIACDREEAYRKRHAYHLAYRREVTRAGMGANAMRVRFTPPWQSKAERAAIAAFYNARPKGMIVDHDVPFIHDAGLVVGLHVLANLRMVTHADNVKKGGVKRLTTKAAAALVARGVAIWRRDVSEDFRSVNWEPYRP